MFPDWSDWYARNPNGTRKNTASQARPGASSTYGIRPRGLWNQVIGLAQPEIRFCHCVRYFWLFNAALSKRCTFESVAADGKISWLFATDGFSLSAACFAPVTGGM